MAKKIAIKIKLEGPQGYFYTAKKNPRTHTEKIKRRKYNPKTRKHEEFVEKKISEGYSFCTADADGNKGVMKTKGFYNLKLVLSGLKMEDIVTNDLDFDREHTVYILTGANRGGKTTATQGVGILYVLAQGGICVPATSFCYSPVDCIYTHFPADEDKTYDLGRLGEECMRFKECYNHCTADSLCLLNESFSTTSFEEGYYIARDSVKALLKKSEII